jgi:hypothetical protein
MDYTPEKNAIITTDFINTAPAEFSPMGSNKKPML